MNSHTPQMFNFESACLTQVDTQEKPYKCPHCPLRFSRGDLCRRHSVTHKVEEATDSSHHPPQKRRRTRIACDNCNSRKLRCEEERPCSRCQVDQVECLVSEERQTRRNACVNEDQNTLLDETLAHNNSDPRPITLTGCSHNEPSLLTLLDPFQSNRPFLADAEDLHLFADDLHLVCALNSSIFSSVHVLNIVSEAT